MPPPGRARKSLFPGGGKVEPPQRGDRKAKMEREEIINKKFPHSFWGYDITEVDLFLDEMIRELDRLHNELDIAELAAQAARQREERLKEKLDIILNGGEAYQEELHPGEEPAFEEHETEYDMRDEPEEEQPEEASAEEYAEETPTEECAEELPVEALSEEAPEAPFTEEMLPEEAPEEPLAEEMLSEEIPPEPAPAAMGLGSLLADEPADPIEADFRDDFGELLPPED